MEAILFIFFIFFLLIPLIITIVGVIRYINGKAGAKKTILMGLILLSMEVLIGFALCSNMFK